MNPTPALSIIVPYYNVENYLGECLASVLEQAFSDYEVLLVDDASTDHSSEVAAQAVAGDARFHFLSLPENRGQSAARNAALDKAMGTYVLFLDADDAYVPGALDRLLVFACEHNLDCLDFSATTFYDPQSDTHFIDTYEGRTSIEGVHSGPELFCRYQQLKEYYCSPCMHLIKRSLLEEAHVRFLEGYTHEDELFSPLVHAYARRAAFLNEDLYMRRVRSDSTMTSRRGMKNIACMFKMSQELYAWLMQHGSDYSQEFRSAMAQRVFELRQIAARDAATVATSQQLDEFAQSLALPDRIDFNEHVRQAAYGIHRIYDGVRAHRSFQVGKAVLALPIWIKDRAAKTEHIQSL